MSRNIIVKAGEAGAIVVHDQPTQERLTTNGFRLRILAALISLPRLGQVEDG